MQSYSCQVDAFQTFRFIVLSPGPGSKPGPGPSMARDQARLGPEPTQALGPYEFKILCDDTINVYYINYD